MQNRCRKSVKHTVKLAMITGIASEHCSFGKILKFQNLPKILPKLLAIFCLLGSSPCYFSLAKILVEKLHIRLYTVYYAFQYIHF